MIAPIDPPKRPSLSAVPLRTQPVETLARSPQALRATALVAWLMSLLVAGVILAQQPLQSANDRSRWCTVRALVEEGSYRIDRVRQFPGWNTIDLVRLDGNFYSTKPPLLPTMVAGGAWLICRVTGWNFAEHSWAICQTLLLLLNGVPWIAVLWVWRLMLLRYCTQLWCALWLLVLLGTGTLLTPFLGTFNNHVPAAAGLALAIAAWLWLLHRPRAVWAALSLGTALGWAVVNELPALAFVAGLGALAFMMPQREGRLVRWVACITPLLVWTALWFGTNYLANGTFSPTYANYGGPAYKFVDRGVPSYWLEPQGIDRNVDQPPMYLLHCTIGHHGIWSLTPVWLLTLWGWFGAGWFASPAHRWLNRLSLATTVIVLAFYGTRLENYNYGGVSCALRWSLWLVPLWIYSLLPVVDRLAMGLWGRTGLMVLLAASLLSVATRITDPWRQPVLFEWMERAGWIDYSSPPPAFSRPLWSWLSRLPANLSDRDRPWCEWSTNLPDGSLGVRRISLRGPLTAELCPLTLAEFRDIPQPEGATRREPVYLREVDVLVEPFQAGKPPASWLRWPASEANNALTIADQLADLAWLRGIPSLREYSPGVIRYLFTPLRDDAYRTQRAATQVDHATPAGPARRYRCDLWISDELPFGTAQFEHLITDAASGEVVLQQRWTLRSAGIDRVDAPVR